MLQHIANPPLPVVWEKGVLSRRLGATSIDKTTTDQFPLDHVTIRTGRINDGHDAAVTVYHDTQNSSGGYRRRLMAGLNCYGNGDQAVSLNGTIDMDRLEDFVQTLRDIQSQLKSLNS